MHIDGELDIILAMPRSVIKKTWRITNKVDKEWPEEIKIVSSDDRFKYDFPSLKPLKGGEVAELSIRILIPDEVSDENIYQISFYVANK